MREIAQAAGGRAVAGMYNHFPNKQAIFRPLLETRNPYDDLFAILETMQSQPGPDFVADLLRRALPTMIQHLDFLERLQIDLREFQGANFAQIVKRRSRLPGLKLLSPMVLVRIMASLVIGYILTEHFIPDVIHDQVSAEQ
jgi:AcrR family transcriptional regulator